ncbi:MFS transporter [Legionella saoudiensis]|uniref:MFS transporter n=1 Tax=Legionella saoudiensis TaxID=1750561 RepID=UPI000731AD77|nr:MFS transporter [Legionella saoudiensis]
MNNNQYSIQGAIIWLLSVSFYLYEFLLRTLVGTFQEPIMHDLNLSTLNFTLISSTAYLFVYGLMQIPIGAIITRYGFKKSIFFASLICSIATLGFSCSTNLAGALFFRALMGLGSAFGFVGVLVAVYDWMPRNNLALFIGLSQFLGTLGPMFAGGPFNELAHSSIMTWQQFFFILSLIGLLLSLLMSLFIRNKSNAEDSFIILEKTTQFKTELMAIIKQKQFWDISIYCALIYFSLEYLSENECKNLLAAKGFDSSFSSYMITLSWFGFALGSPLFGYFSDKIKLRKPILVFSAVTSFFSLFFIVYIPLAEWGAIIAFFAYGFGIGSASVGIAIMTEQFKTNQVSSALGINNAVTMLSASVMAPIISYILSINATHIGPTLADYQRVFSLLALLPIVSLLIVLFKIKETFGRSSKEPIILNYEQS